MVLITADIIIYYVHLFSKKGHRTSAGILEQSMWSRNRVGIGLSQIVFRGPEKKLKNTVSGVVRSIYCKTAEKNWNHLTLVKKNLT
jgi:hypothetical protein